MTLDAIIDELIKKETKLHTLLDSITEKLDTLPKAKLVATTTKVGLKYYKRIQPGNKLVYIRHADKEQIAQLQHVNYLNLLKSNAEQEIDSIEKALKILRTALDPEKAFAQIDYVKRSLIKPYEMPVHKNASFVTNNKYYAPRPNSNLLTKAGERVRSKSELIIANKLFDAGIPYCYEMNTAAGPMLQYNPDFTVINKVTGKLYYWEHFGMIDDSTYGPDCQIKLENLARAGIFPGKNLIATFETSKRALDTEYVDMLIKEYLL